MPYPQNIAIIDTKNRTYAFSKNEWYRYINGLAEKHPELNTQFIRIMTAINAYTQKVVCDTSIIPAINANHPGIDKILAPVFDLLIDHVIKTFDESNSDTKISRVSLS